MEGQLLGKLGLMGALDCLLCYFTIVFVWFWEDEEITCGVILPLLLKVSYVSKIILFFFSP